MRSVTRDEANEWMALAQEHGYVNKQGQLELGRFEFEPEVQAIRIVTPFIAPLFKEDLTRKTPPIQFDRTPDGQLIIPGRLWQDVMSRLSEVEDLTEELRAAAAQAARHMHVEDAYLPAETYTIAMRAPDDQDEVVTFEALKPGTYIGIQMIPMDKGK
jgi:hypothetical protein